MASTHLGLPLAIVSQLCESGHLGTAPDSSGRRGFSDRELREFTDKFPNGTGPCKAGARTISLGRALTNLLAWNVTAKHDLVVAVIERKLKVVGGGGDIGGLVLDLRAVKAFLAGAGRKEKGRLWSLRQAAEFLDCIEPAIRPLVNLGWLADVGEDGVAQISDESLASFHRRYISGMSLARTMKVTVRLLLSSLQSGGIEPISIKNPYGTGSVHFIKREDIHDIQRPTSKRKASAQRRLARQDPLDGLASYFERLRMGGMPLPRRARLPNKVAIAAACGIGRQIFDTPRGRAMLAAFDAEDRARHSVDSLDYVGTLKFYLQSLVEAGQPLPLVGQQINKRAIAEACGFNRNLLYTDDEMRGLLATHVADESFRLARA